MVSGDCQRVAPVTCLIETDSSEAVGGFSAERPSSGHAQLVFLAVQVLLRLSGRVEEDVAQLAAEPGRRSVGTRVQDQHHLVCNSAPAHVAAVLHHLCNATTASALWCIAQYSFSF